MWSKRSPLWFKQFSIGRTNLVKQNKVSEKGKSIYLSGESVSFLWAQSIDKLRPFVVRPWGRSWRNQLEITELRKSLSAVSKVWNLFFAAAKLLCLNLTGILCLAKLVRTILNGEKNFNAFEINKTLNTARGLFGCNWSMSYIFPRAYGIVVFLWFNFEGV